MSACYQSVRALDPKNCTYTPGPPFGILLTRVNVSSQLSPEVVVPITDGWFNVSRLSDDEPVQAADAFLEPGDRLFGGGGGEAWLSVTLDQGLAAMEAAGVERALLTVSPGGPAPVISRPPLVDVGLEACRRADDRLRLVLALEDVSDPVLAASQVAEFGELDEVVAIGVWPSFLRCGLNGPRLYPRYAACVAAN